MTINLLALAALLPYKRLFIIALFLVGFFGPVQGRFDLVRCCIKAARDRQIMDDLQQNPWDICKYNQPTSNELEEQLESIKKSRAWCKTECIGYQRSATNQWLQPLATWIIPYVSFLLLCPIGEGEEDREKKRSKEDGTKDDGTKDKGASILVLTRLKIDRLLKLGKGSRTFEYVLLLGDPASALWGAFAEIQSDCKLARKLSTPTSSWLTKKAIWIAMLTGDTKFRYDRLWEGFIDSLALENYARAEKLRALQEPLSSDPSPWKALAEEVAAWPVGNENESFDEKQDPDAIQKSKYGVTSAAQVTPGRTSQVSMERGLSHAIHVLVQARIDFLKGIFIPVVLMLMVTASVFFDGYHKLGDKDTAHALAYGIWYSWLITLSVAGNCFATSGNVELAQKSFGHYLKLSKRRVSPSERYLNTFDWNLWLWYIMSADPRKPQSGPIPTRGAWFWAKFLLGQTVGWICVAFACGCAAIISWTTPTAGLGCRSFTFLLYAIVAFIVAIINVVRQWLEKKSTSRRGGQQFLVLFTNVVKVSYGILVIFNALIMILGTIFHLSGVYRSCWCSRLFASDETLLEFNRKTEESINNAKRYWLVTGYIAFSGVWIICGLTVAARKYMVWKIELALLKSAKNGR
ncbi:hypothetical protein GQ43DRAFT_431009 [Delitschia confertaspora ATCC 74209]|uniref:Uncharacterized protein n=1 Tax=Delitschia confertaspora ATCC 74209 TaxID=1513339 RepID=A0A9P4MWH3_9PLEO|nr:hypothetical protein GQ43DRAFT_431009 [Delitschia confertaspora ATCC 74209]